MESTNNQKTNTVAEKKYGLVAMQTEMDAMSAICAIIDDEKTKRGMDV